MGCEKGIFFLILLLGAGPPAQDAAQVRSTDSFMSSIDMKNLFRMEMALVEVLRKHKAQLEATLNSIHSYTHEVEALYEGENCWPPQECSDDILVQKIVGNPIYNYQMLKRFLV